MFSSWLEEAWDNRSHVVRILCVLNLVPAPKEGAAKPSISLPRWSVKKVMDFSCGL